MPDQTANNHLPAWEARFRSPVLGFPAWVAAAPDRLVVGSSESGSYQLYARDLGAGVSRRVTDHPVGVLSGRPTPDATGITWFHDATGDERGTWVVAPFDGDGEAVPLVDGLPAGWSSGLAMGRQRIVAGIADADLFSVWVAEDGGPARLLYSHPQPVSLAGAELAGCVDAGALSADEAIVALEVSEDGDVLHPALRAIDAGTGATLAELRDPGAAVAGLGFSPVPGDDRIAVAREVTGDRRPALWNARTGEVADLPVDLPGDVDPVAWWPDASALLLLALEAGRNRLFRYDLGDGSLVAIPSEPGSITAAGVRPDGTVWYRGHSGEHPALLLAAGSDVPVLEPDGPASRGRPMETWWFTNPQGQAVHGFLVRPEGDGPHPVIMRVHGGPHFLDTDRWVPDIQAHVDAGFLVAMVNYRGSTGFGREWRDALTGNVGFLELEDVLAGLDDLVARGIADPARVVLAGWSWGGYITLLGAGRHPDRFISAVAGVPVADYVAAFEDEAPGLQALDRALFGGTPAERPEFYRERSPLTYADAVQAPLLILAGENDSRCPIRQVWNYVGALRARGFEPRVYTYRTGHASYDIAERVRQTAIVLDFLAATVPGVARLDGIDGYLPAA